MKFRRTDEFKRDFKRLKPEHQAAFRAVVRERFAPACDGWAAASAEHGAYVWPASLRVSELKNTQHIMEMTWSFASPDGRATFQLERLEDEWFCIWRRVGDHAVFSSP